jgi:hypothetical protein
MKEFDDHFTGDPDFNWEDEPGCEGRMETYSPYVDQVQEQCEKNIKKVWTIVDGDEDDRMYAIPGFHYVNRFLYFISNEEWENEEEIYLW